MSSLHGCISLRTVHGNESRSCAYSLTLICMPFLLRILLIVVVIQVGVAWSPAHAQYRPFGAGLLLGESDGLSVLSIGRARKMRSLAVLPGH